MADHKSPREKHLAAARWENFRSAWFTFCSRPREAAECSALARGHMRAAQDETMGRPAQ